MTTFDPEFTTLLTDRLAGVSTEMAAAAARVDRAPESVRLVAVTKTHPAALLRAATAAGVREIGENYVREAAEKFAELGWTTPAVAPVRRHFIGHLQSNKVRQVLPWFDVIQTMDSLALADRLERIAVELGREAVPVFIQVNTSGEASKSGFAPDTVAGALPHLARCPHLQVRGLMTIGRFTPDPEAARREFRLLRELRDSLRAQAPAEISLDDLSMGMSHDFPIAIEEGATLVRVGSRLFGPR